MQLIKFNKLILKCLTQTHYNFIILDLDGCSSQVEQIYLPILANKKLFQYARPCSTSISLKSLFCQQKPKEQTSIDYHYAVKKKTASQNLCI
jgi:hypothetical protein